MTKLFSLLVFGLAIVNLEAVPVDLSVDKGMSIKAGTYTLFDIAIMLMDRGFIVNTESIVHLPTTTLELKAERISPHDLVEIAHRSFGYDCIIQDETITFVDAGINKADVRYALNATLTGVDLKDVTASEAVKILAKEFDLPILPHQFRRSDEMRKISLHLDHATVREVFDAIERASGSAGWTSSLSTIHTGDGRSYVFVVM